MKPLTLTAVGEAPLTYQLKEGWHEVTVAEYIAYESTIAPLKHPRHLPPLAEWLSGIPVDLTRRNLSLAAQVVRACPWIRSLPEAAGPVPIFEHDWITYHHVGNLDVVSVGQLEALIEFLDAHRAQPAGAFPWLLAVLYRREGSGQSADEVTEVAEAFATLSIATAWPALAFFLANSVPLARRIQQYSAAHAEASRALTTLETLMQAQGGASAGFWSRIRSACVLRWIDYAKRVLKRCSM